MTPGYKEEMEMKAKNRAIATVLALVLTIGCVFGIGLVAAAEGETSYSLGYANVVYGDQISLAFTIDGATEGDNVGIVVYKNEGDETPMYCSNEVKGEEVKYFETFGIAAKDIDTTYYVAVAEFNEDGTVAKVVTAATAYSVEAYANARLEDEGISEDQEALYKAILVYNKAADAVLSK